MKLVGQLIRTAVNVAELPLALAKDTATLGGVATGRRKSYTEELAEKIKEEASE
jgi:hypothetical protein